MGDGSASDGGPALASGRSGGLLTPVLELAHDQLTLELQQRCDGFLARYFKHLSSLDLKAREPRDLLGAALAHLRLGEVRAEGTANVHVFNPDLAANGWQSPHTVVQIVTDDMPFLVDSVRMAMTALGLGIHLVIHPMLRVVREDGRYVRVEEGAANEAWMYLEVDRCDGARQEALRQRLVASLDDVRVAVADWRPMRERCDELAHELEHSVLPLGTGEAARASQFLRWLSDDHLVFLGYREYDFTRDADGQDVVVAAPGTGLGLLRDGRRVEEPHPLSSVTDEARRMIFAPSVLMLTTANSRSTVCRADYLAYIGVKKFDREGRVIGERRFLGLYNSDVYRDSVLDIPLLRDKAAEVLDRAGFAGESHSGRALRQILETYPRNELFQIDVDELYEIATGILELQDRRQVRLFERRDDYGRFVSCLVYLPRDRYSTDRAEQIAAALQEAYGGTGTEHEVLIGMGALARLYVRVALGTEVRRPTIVDVEKRLSALVADWSDELGAALVGELGEDAGLDALARYANAFPADYRDAYPPAIAAADVSHLLEIEHGADLITSLHRPLGCAPEEVRFTLMRPGAPLVLSEVLPLLEDLGVTVVDERTHEIRLEGQSVWRYDIGLRLTDAAPIDDRASREEFCATFAALFRGELESDGLNQLVLAGGLTARQVDILRAYAKYLRQVGLSFSQSYVETTLARHAPIVRALVRLFETRFDPSIDADAATGGSPARAADAQAIADSIITQLDAVPSLDEDRILRAFLTLILATQRTNAYRPKVDGDPRSGPRPVLSFKLDPQTIPDLPLPRPMFEIWVYAPGVEGVHLRGGPVARGGLRWSDRREDFRTEVLGLMKAQMVKNAVIVPVGAKGGFVVKRRERIPDAEQLRLEVAKCYREFVAGLLDVTDNVVDGRVVPPPDVVRHDGDDPYLVVAADKGTATYSDLANSVAESYGFWLGDAFASGGSAGYDHKAMGITARGAWESARRHARSLGRDADIDPVTVVGIGDMSGDVFGNGMLRTEHLRLVAAFDHRHLFLDPDPDPERSFAERQRLFDLPRSSWDDYDRSVISPGGGVWPRSAKAIPLSDEVRRVLDVTALTMTPNELLSTILRAPVDLLWNGGIGTYVKASTENNAEVGDRANDAIRVDGNELRCAMVVEGGNLGLTQRGRVEAALSGVLLNTDAIDNSAGVDCSDHEVNIKILLDAQVAAGDLTVKQRNELLGSMTDELAELVLEDNRAQTLALSIARRQAGPMVDVHTRYLRSLEVEGLINRTLEFLPNDKQLSERATAGQGLTIPEFAVLLAYTKDTNTAEVLRSDLPDDPYVQRELVRYFPSALRERFAGVMGGHRLRREIIATVLTNEMVNRAGTSFDFRMTDETGAGVADITRAHVVSSDVHGMVRWWDRIDHLDPSIDTDVQFELFLDLRRMVERGVLWLLRHRRPPLDLGATVAAFGPGIEELAGGLRAVVHGAMGATLAEAAEDALNAGVPSDLAEASAVWPIMHTGWDLVEVAQARGRSPLDAAAVYWGLFDGLDVAWLWDRVGKLPRTDRWQSHARAAQRDDLMTTLRDLTDDALRTGDVFTPCQDLVSRWLAANERTVRRLLDVFLELRTGGVFDLTTLSVALRQLRNLVLVAASAH
jgi:glutamate dehydrogenase